MQRSVLQSYAQGGALRLILDSARAHECIAGVEQLECIDRCSLRVSENDAHALIHRSAANTIHGVCVV